jgi:hypothetical protein
MFTARLSSAGCVAVCLVYGCLRSMRHTTEHVLAPPFTNGRGGLPVMAAYDRMQLPLM